MGTMKIIDRIEIATRRANESVNNFTTVTFTTDEIVPVFEYLAKLIRFQDQLKGVVTNSIKNGEDLLHKMERLEKL